MRSIVHIMRASVRFVIVVVCAALLIVIRYILKTPQSLTSKIAGEPRFYMWPLGKIFYQVHGPLDAPALVLLHTPEIGGSSYEMRHLVPGLAHHYRVYVPDLPGFGLSDRPALTYSATTYQSFLEDFLANCVLQPASLIASGLSATYSQAFANAHPNDVQRLVLLTPLQGGTTSKKSIFEPLAPLLHTSIGALGLYAFITRRPILQRVIAWEHGEVPANVSAEELEYFYASAHQRGAEHAASAWLIGDLNCQLSVQSKQPIYPTLLIQGSQTPGLLQINGTTGSRGTALTDMTNIQIAIIEGSGRRAHVEQPERVLERLLNWLHDSDTILQTAALLDAPSTTLEPLEALKLSIEIPSSETSVQQNGIGLLHEEISIHTAEEKETPLEAENGPIVEAYCVKCRQKRIMLSPKQVVTKNGRKAMEGTCPICSTRLFRFV